MHLVLEVLLCAVTVGVSVVHSALLVSLPINLAPSTAQTVLQVTYAISINCQQIYGFFQRLGLICMLFCVIV